MYLFTISEEGRVELKELGTLGRSSPFQKVSVIDEDDELHPGH
jgi:hypothetical protein